MLTFHATGAGGRAMEKLIASGMRAAMAAQGCASPSGAHRSLALAAAPRPSGLCATGLAGFGAAIALAAAPRPSGLCATAPRWLRGV